MTGPSVALATYNGARFIAEQLDSLARQALLPAELVVTDDTSTDNTPEIVTAFAAKAPFPVRYEKNVERLGYQLNFLKAAGLCRNEFIAFCDQDDVWQPNKLAACMQPFSDSEVLLTYHNATVVTAALEQIDTLASYAAPRAVNPPQSLGPWRYGLGFTLIFRRELLAFNDLWPMTINFNDFKRRESHDQWFFFLASTLGSVGYVDDLLVAYRQHDANTFGWGGLPGYKQKLEKFFCVDMTAMESCERNAGKRSAILAQMEPRLAGERRQRAQKAATLYRQLEEIYRLRQEMYSSGNPLSRLQRFTSLAQSGAYKAVDQWGIGHKAMLKDIIAGVLFAGRKTVSRS
jgi:glycosyltransferase involved in cell wall biosynthesis